MGKKILEHKKWHKDQVEKQGVSSWLYIFLFPKDILYREERRNEEIIWFISKIYFIIVLHKGFHWYLYGHQNSKFQCWHFEELLLLQLLGQPYSNINGALWQFALLSCFWWTLSRQRRAKWLAMLVTGIIEVVGLVWMLCVWTEHLTADSVYVPHKFRGSKSNFWSN